MFAIAEDAYSHMKRDLKGQTIIVSGERYVILSYEFLKETHRLPHSGAGKTESVGSERNSKAESDRCSFRRPNLSCDTSHLSIMRKAPKDAPG